MKSNRGFLFCAIASVTLWAGFANADDASVTLDLNYSSGAGSSGTWQLLGRIDDTGTGASGDFGLSAIRALINDIDFGTLGDAVTFATGIGSIDPIAENTPFERPAVLQQLGGTIDLVYGQDLSESETFPGSGVFRSVVINVGNSGDTLLASGTFSAGLTPAFGQDDTGVSTLFTQALFLPAGSTPFTTGAIDADNTFTLVTDNLPAGVTGDYNGNGIVDAADYTVWLDALGSAGPLPNDPLGGTIGSSHYDQWKTNFGNTSGTGTGSESPVPEPSTLVLAFAMASTVLCCRKRS